MKNLIFLFFAWLAFVPMANAVGSGVGESREIYNCNLPAPSNLQIIDITATSLTGQWDVVPGASQYLVEVYRVSDNTFLGSLNTTNNVATVNSLPAGTLCRFEVSPICSTGQKGGTSGVEATTDIIIDLVAGVSPECPNLNLINTQYGVYSSSSLTILSNVMEMNTKYMLEVLQQGQRGELYSNRFFVEFFEDNNVISQWRAQISPVSQLPNSSQLGVLHGETGFLDQPRIRLSYDVNPDWEFADFRCVVAANTINLTSNINMTIKDPGYAPNGEYQVKFYKCGNKPQANEKSSDEPFVSLYSSYQFDVFPNPAHDVINIRAKNEFLKNGSSIEIWGASGRIVYANYFAGEGLITIDSERFSESFYIVKITSGDYVEYQKLLVVKS